MTRRWWLAHCLGLKASRPPNAFSFLMDMSYARNQRSPKIHRTQARASKLANIGAFGFIARIRERLCREPALRP